MRRLKLPDRDIAEVQGWLIAFVVAILFVICFAASAVAAEGVPRPRGDEPDRGADTADDVAKSIGGIVRWSINSVKTLPVISHLIDGVDAGRDKIGSAISGRGGRKRAASVGDRQFEVCVEHLETYADMCVEMFPELLPFVSPAGWGSGSATLTGAAGTASAPASRPSADATGEAALDEITLRTITAIANVPRFYLVPDGRCFRCANKNCEKIEAEADCLNPDAVDIRIGAVSGHFD